ncbi:MAG TPA: hypothetical protein VHA75_19895, partial [Rugosimonospora sp.]|nr:hypothetical protein [Rugosimonospora sp.]
MATTVRPRKYSNGRKVATGVLCVLGAFVLAASIGARSWVLTALGVALVGGGVALWIVSWAGETRVANAAAGRRPAPSAATASEDDVAEPLYGDSDLYGVADSDGTGTTTGSETGDDSRFIEMDLRPDLSGDGAPRPTVGRKDAPMGGWPGGDPRGDDFAQAPEGSAALAGTNNP